MSVEQPELNQSQDVVVDTAGKMNEVKDLLDNMQKNPDDRKQFAKELTKSVEGILNSLDDETKVKLANSVAEIFNKHKGDAGFDNVKAGLLSIGNILGLKEEDGKLVQTQVDAQANEVDNPIKIELSESPLKGKLVGITPVEIKEGDPEDEKGEQNFYKGKGETVRINESSEEGKESALDMTKGVLQGQIDGISSIDTSKFSDEDKVKIDELKKFLGSVKDVINNTTKENIVILQSFISENLKGTDEGDKFDSASKMSNGKFDGKFGKGTLTGLNKVLENTGKFIDDVSNKFAQIEAQETSDKTKLDKVTAITDKKVGKGSEVKAEDLVSGVEEGVEVKFVEGKEVTANEVGTHTGEVVVKAGSKERRLNVTLQVEDNTPSIDETPLTFGDGQYLTMSNSQALASEIGLSGRAMFYSVQPQNPPIEAQDGKWQTAEVPGTGADYECFLQIDGSLEKTYRVKIDQKGNLCPVARNANSKVPVLFENNDSCKRYLINKLPPVLQNKGINIGWDGSDYTIGISGGEERLTIEPMTIDEKWVGKNLSENLAFLNFTNYLRNKKDIQDIAFKNDNPDLRLQGDNLLVRVNKKSNRTYDENGNVVKMGKRYPVNKELFGLPSDVTTLQKFIKYNNHEDRGDNWDAKKENRYYRKVNINR